jgi:hypothetical protein
MYAWPTISICLQQGEGGEIVGRPELTNVFIVRRQCYVYLKITGADDLHCESGDYEIPYLFT